MLAPIAWPTPPPGYGPWETVASLLTEELVRRGVDVTLFATKNSRTAGRLHAICPRGYEEDRTLDGRAWSALHIAEVFERADDFDIIHNHFDYSPLTYSSLVRTPVVTTIHGLHPLGILPVYQKYNATTFYVAISNASRRPELSYVATVYHGIDLTQFTFRPTPENSLLFFARVAPDKGIKEAIEIARRAKRRLRIAGLITDQAYYDAEIAPLVDDETIQYLGNVGPAARDQLLGGAAALLNPIRIDEPFGLSVAEALACGTPVIAFNRGSMPELIADGTTGFLVGSVDEAVAAVGRIATIDRRNCRRRIEERFTVQHMADGYLRVYAEVLRQTEGRRAAGALSSSG
jgi:glycosyltransferase involved in cell wall biosynthesis